MADEAADVVRRLDVDIERHVDRRADRRDLRERQVGRQVDGRRAEAFEHACGGRVRGREHHRDLGLHVLGQHPAERASRTRPGRRGPRSIPSGSRARQRAGNPRGSRRAVPGRARRRRRRRGRAPSPKGPTLRPASRTARPRPGLRATRAISSSSASVCMNTPEPCETRCTRTSRPLGLEHRSRHAGPQSKGSRRDTARRPGTGLASREDRADPPGRTRSSEGGDHHRSILRCRFGGGLSHDSSTRFAATATMRAGAARTYECDGLTGRRVIPRSSRCRDAGEVQAVVRSATSGSRSSPGRGTGFRRRLPVADGIVISLARMNRVLDVDLDAGHDRRRARRHEPRRHARGRGRRLLLRAGPVVAAGLHDRRQRRRELGRRALSQVRVHGQPRSRGRRRPAVGELVDALRLGRGP